MSYNKKRKIQDIGDIYSNQIENKTNKIQRQLIDCIINYDKLEHNIHENKINEMYINASIKDYDVKISSTNNKASFACSCSSLDNYNNFYCKHIAMAIKEIIKTYINENIKYISEKKDYDILKENIDFLNTNIMNFNISDKKYDETEF